MSNLKTVIDRLKSERVKERQEGVALLRSAFAREDAVYSIEDGRGWLVLYQALFTTVKIEKVDTVKKNGKSGTAAQRRLMDAAAAVRWLVERSVHCLSKKALTPLLGHLTQMLVHRGQLFTPVALDYIKTIKVLLSWTPHIDHLNVDIWLKLVEISFNIILDDPIEDDLVRTKDQIAGSVPADDSMYQSDSSSEDGNLPSSRKRPLREHSSTPIPRTAPDNPTDRCVPRHSVSLEQIECASLLALLFRHTTAPFLAEVERPDPGDPDSFPKNFVLVPITPSLFWRMKRFLERYPTDTSLHHDYLLALQPFLCQVALNCRREIDDFACSAWDALVGLWGTKNKRIKESLVGTLKTLFPFLTATRDAPNHGWADSVQRLWTLLIGEADSRWGIEALSIDSLRLQVSDERADERQIFVAQTFRAGWNFDAGQALAWALLELQADCAKKLFEHFESVHTGSPEGSTSKGKRAKREDPVSSLLYSLRATSTMNVRVYHLQILLFFIDRHWHRLHNSLQNDVIATVLQFVSVDEVPIQSWAFLCLAAIAHCDGTQSPSLSRSDDTLMANLCLRRPATWDPIWTHAMRRANVPVVCRAACHTAHTLVGYSRHLLTPQRVLAEIESLAKDLDLQGPSFPYDAVCMFLAQCLRVASQDVRLYRMQLEEKVLSWLLDNWRVGTSAKEVSGRSRMPPHTICDFLDLLESICGCSRRSDPVCRMVLPDCDIVNVMEEHYKTRIIRDYVLHAELPVLSRYGSSLADISVAKNIAPPTTRADQELVPPRGRERRVSAFLIKAMESLISEWEMARDNKMHPTAEKVRQSLDAAITSLMFESLLSLNGTHSNRRVIQSAAKVVVLLAPFTTDAKWTPEERLLILKAFEPLVVETVQEDIDDGWTALIEPGLESGIKSHIIRSLQTRISSNVCSHNQRRYLQLLWENTDVQNAFGTIAINLRQLLGTLTDQSIEQQYPGTTEHDGFGPIRTTQSTTPQEEYASPVNLATRSLAEICIVFLASAPSLQCPTEQMPRDKELVKLIIDCPEEKLLLLGPPLLNVVRRRLLTFSLDVLDNLLVKCADLLRRYSHALNDQFHFLVVDLLKSSLHIWMAKESATSPICGHVQVLCGWISNMMEATETKKKSTFWKIRDLVGRFLAGYLAEDPSQTFWPTDYHEVEIKRPLSTLLALNLDEDIRVRFRAAALCAGLFSVDRDELIHEYENLDGFYQLVRDSLPRDLAQYECMLTRTICLGNIMIASSYVRRGPYWHLLEATFHSPWYSRHIQAVLRGVSERLGLSRPSELFEAYASQIALSIRQNFLDILRLPPNLLGYENRRECAEAAFHLFTPANLMESGGSQEAIAHGQQLFVNHCFATQKTTADGLRSCIGDLIGLQLVSLVDTTHVSDSTLVTRLEDLFRSKGIDLQPLGGFMQCVRQNAAGITASVIRSLGDQDFSDDGAIVEGLRAHGLREAARTFVSLNKYRHLNDFRFHPPNLPRFSTGTILRSLQWCTSVAISEHVTAISYHVLHQIFAELHSTPFVNEQLRLLNGIGLLVAVLSERFKDPTLLHTFIQKSSSLLAEADLIQAAQSYLEWGFSVYQMEVQLDQRFPDILIRVCALLDADHATSSVAGVLKRNQGFSKWIDERALVLCRNLKIKAQVLKALPAWSHQPSPALLSVIEDITADSLSVTLSDHCISSNKFRLVRRLLELAEQHAYSKSQFAMTDFWRLKDYIPPKTYLQRDDIDAFASLLAANTGGIYGFGSEHPCPQTLRARHLRSTRLQDEAHVNHSPQRSVIQTLLAMLDGVNPSEVHLVYLTLRSLVSASSEETLAFHLWSAEYLPPLEFFRQFPTALSIRPTRSITELDSISPPTDFTRWICSLSTLLSDILNSSDKFYAQLIPLIANNVQFAEEILPVLVHTLLSMELSQGASSLMSTRKNLSDYFTAILAAEDPSGSCKRAIVDVILHLRCFRPIGSDDSLAHDKWLDVNYCRLAKSAVSCGSYTTALLFLELAFEYGQLDKESPDSIEHLLFEIYGHIDEPDGFYGIKTTDLHHFLIKRFHHEDQWDKAFRFHGAAIEAGSRESIDADGLLQSFHAFGFDSLAIGTLQGSQKGFQSDGASSTMSYQLGWRTETWDLPDTGDFQDSNIGLYRALRAIYRERDSHVIDATVQSALCDAMERLRILGNEDITEIREIARNIMCLNQLTQWRRGPTQEHLSRKSPDIRLMTQLVDIDPEFEFNSLERILATRTSLIRSVRRKEERERIGHMITPFNNSLLELEKRCLVRLSVAARKSNKLQVALNSIVKARRLEGNSTHEVSQEFAHVLWLQNEQKLAVQFLKDLLSRQNQTASSKPEQVIERALSMARLGSWISEACLEKPMDIKHKYFDAATTLATEVEKQVDTRADACASVFHKCALFAEHQYHVIIKSPDALRWRTYVGRKSQEIKQRESQLRRTLPGTNEYRALFDDQKKAEAVLAEDEEAYKQHNGALATFLDLAINMYSRCLAASDVFDDDVPIRFCSLWFANFEDRRLQDTLKKAVTRIPSRKFVFLSHQLSARISHPSQDELPASQQILQGLVIRMCQEHPFHSLYQVYCIRPERSGQSSLSRRLSSRHEPTLSQAQLDRSSAATDIFDRLLSDPRHSTRVKAIEQVCDVSIEWARYPVKDTRGIKKVNGQLHIPDSLAIRRLRDIQVPVVTSHPVIDATLKYDRCVWISHYDPTFMIPGGVNVPKVSICYGSNGEKYWQLFKGGNDDLRQDAVMEQVFDLVNVVLGCDRETKKRDLKVRGYTVLPLAAQAGVLEFVGDTVPLQTWLGNAHPRYRPNDLRHTDILNILKQTRERHQGRVDAMLAQFKDICEKSAPVMRHYFTEKHKSPIAWFAMRLNYIRSVATTSIVGHVLGLGDRHVSNILMDNVTGEVVHIDLGIAFDQGKSLRVPERVPFRMTRDMVDGMGYSGTQGVFHRCAEETLRVLRERSDVIMTVLEVFKHDPLHSWTASELKIKKIQDSTNEPVGRVPTEHSRFGLDQDNGANAPVNEAADRALNSVARKLDKSLSVEYTVNELIAEATDIVNLATIYHGWSPDY
ncbi:hypothetical protein L210DRAFT_3618742 [Boletus edulis BED1]|uniref:Serine/threonine-protein kinase Tel1 n=1 Tax=Boletus edulis BED1 TaxID=1328754 RepID=A0AAD4C557_BOLED|nr:hypothetical protein L210DRAFT_3618742 [Boletus edulis BED1]